MNVSKTVSYFLAAFLAGGLAGAQITLINSASGGSRYATTTGRAISIDKSNFRIGAASCLRKTASANSSYLPTGIVLDPKTNGRNPKGNKGFTIQFWYRPSAPTTFQYLFGDALWVGTSGAFRCFQNGAAGSGNLFIRGPLSQRATTGAPLNTKLGPKGWIHLAVVVDATLNRLSWYVNGTLNTSGPANITGKGKNFTCMGYNGSSSAGTTGNFDDFRVYNWARTAAEIAGDYKKRAVGANLPDSGYYECEAAVNPHVAQAGIGTEVLAPYTHLFTAGDTLVWTASSTAAGPFPAVCMLNIFIGGPGTPRKDAYLAPPAVPGGPYHTSILPGLELGHWLSTPAKTKGVLFWPTAVLYGGSKVGKLSFPMPNLYMSDGDRIDLQWIAIDPSYPPMGAATTNRLCFEYVTPKPGPHAHVEARGMNVIQETGFWEVWNTGTIPIKKVCIDLATATNSTSWLPTGSLNSGGTLAAGTSFRFLTDKVCDLLPKTNPRYTLTGKALCFTFQCPPAPGGGFQGPTNHFVFDCSTNPARAGNGYVGATVTVTFCNNKVLSGKLVPDPKDPKACQVDF